MRSVYYTDAYGVDVKASLMLRTSDALCDDARDERVARCRDARGGWRLFFVEECTVGCLDQFGGTLVLPDIRFVEE